MECIWSAYGLSMEGKNLLQSSFSIGRALLGCNTAINKYSLPGLEHCAFYNN
jgi:hypothetical protein